MQVPPPLQEAIDQEAASVPPSDLARASSTLSEVYRAASKPPVLDEEARIAYAVTRLPGTYAALAAVLGEYAQRIPETNPSSLLDLGTGPGTGLWAAAETFPGLRKATLVERDRGLIQLGSRLARNAPSALVRRAAWKQADLASRGPYPTHDLVLLSYVLNELPASTRPALAEAAWNATAQALVLIEPGTIAGHETILRVRERLLAVGANLSAPCPHARQCPMTGTGSWCHFMQRIARSRRHRQAKGANLGFEDEKFSYLIFTREKTGFFGSRIIEPVQTLKHAVRLSLCTPGGDWDRLEIARRDNPARFKHARKCTWGDAWYVE